MTFRADLRYAIGMMKKTLSLVSIFLATVHSVSAQEQAPSSEHRIKADVALSALASLSDAYLEKMADSLRILAATSDAKTAKWANIQGPLMEVSKRNVEALNWFALPDGSYWSVQEGKEAKSLSDRPYFSKVLEGKAVIGDLVVSKATGKSVAVVAVPVMREKAVVGVLGASIYLDRLSARLEKEMDLDKTMIFYSFNSTPTVALDWDPSIIFADPKKLGKEVSNAFNEMLKQEEGAVSYTFRGKRRDVVFEKSDRTGWWYAFGIIPEGREQTTASR